MNRWCFAFCVYIRGSVHKEFVPQEKSLENYENLRKDQVRLIVRHPSPESMHPFPLPEIEQNQPQLKVTLGH